MILTQEMVPGGGSQKCLKARKGQGRFGGSQTLSIKEEQERETGRLAGVKSQKFWQEGELLSGPGFREAGQLQGGGALGNHRD